MSEKTILVADDESHILHVVSLKLRNAGFRVITAEDYAPLETWIKEIEAQKISFKGWATPGANPTAAALDLARAIARRAERRVEELLQSAATQNRHLQIYLNRASDLLWLLARWAVTSTET